jgi:integrase
MASVSKRGNRWRVMWRAKDADTGKIRQFQETFDTERDAKERASKIEVELADGVHVSPHRMTVGDLVDVQVKRERNNLRAGNITEGTFRNYEKYLEGHIRTGLGVIPLRQLDTEDIEGFYADLLDVARDPRPLSRSTVRQLHQLIRRMLDYAERDGYVARNVSRLARLPKAPSGKASGRRRAIDRTQVFDFFDANADDDMLEVWRLAIHAGLRRSELVGLGWQHVDLDAGEIRVERTRISNGGKVEVKESTKSEAGTRVVPLDDAGVDALRRIKRKQAAERLHAGPVYEASGYVITDALGRPVHPDRLTKLSKSALRNACSCDIDPELLPKDADEACACGMRTKTLHGLRHTHGTILADAENVNIKALSERLGHTDVAFTLRTYVSPDRETHRAQADAFGKRMTR